MERMHGERKGEGRHSQSPPRAGTSTTRRPLKLPQIRNAKSQIPNPKAFTLIELLVVIAVIALLMAILLPVLGRVRSQARALRCRANLKQWGQVIAMYVEDNEGHLPHWRHVVSARLGAERR